MDKIVILDSYSANPGDLSWEPLSALGELTLYDRTPINDVDEIIKRIGDATAIFTNKTPLSKPVLSACPNLKFIGVLATGYNVVDTASAKELGIVVSNVPAYSTPAVSQFTIALLLEICHHVGHHNNQVHDGYWENSMDFCFWDSPLIELAGKTMGIIGYGQIGQSTAKIAQAMGMNILVYSRTRKPELESDTVRFAQLDDVLSESDVISLHCPLFPETQGIINKNSIAKMKDGVIILNSSRGPLIVEEDLADALNTGKIYAAGLDVASCEPINSDSPLLKAKNCIITPHIAWATKESRQRLLNVAINNLAQFQKGTPMNVVNG